ncbi:MAG: hypothetical protein PHD15_00200 [Clostridia bacterium]|nr:hypothetical protein [Clostridia bacterium]MDD4386173.1 hypothetical protein [Clostridia bacterium]
MNKFAILEIGSNNTKTHIYENMKLIYENNTTIEFKNNYLNQNKINEKDINKLYEEIKKALNYTKNIFIYGCSIFRNITKNELSMINNDLYEKFNLKIEVASQEDEALLTAFGCYNNLDYNGNICIFIGGGGSTEVIVVNNKNIIEKKYFNFGVVDVTKRFDTLKDDIPKSSFHEVYEYIDSIIEDFDISCDLLILAGGDHLYWYNNANYKLYNNELYKNENQKKIITVYDSDKYDKNAFQTSLDIIRNRSDNPIWFDGSRAMKVITNVISHKIGAKYIVPTKINMEDGLKEKIAKYN